MPGQKSIRLAKKGSALSFPKAGFSRFSPATPLPPRFFAETKRGDLGRFLPALFGFGTRSFARATRRAALATNESSLPGGNQQPFVFISELFQAVSPPDTFFEYLWKSSGGKKI
jgi:hypothetical protein